MKKNQKRKDRRTISARRRRRAVERGNEMREVARQQGWGVIKLV